jgi:hypothetical protein
MTTPLLSRRMVTTALLLAVAANTCISPALAHEATPAEAAPGKSHSGPPILPVSLIEGSQNAWSVSRTEAGCYLLSPRRKNSSRLAVGQSPTLGLGLFAVHFALAMPGREATEPVTMWVENAALRKDGRMVGANLLFVPLAPAELASVARTLDSAGTIWLEIRGASLAHAGQDVKGALAAFQEQCLLDTAVATSSKSAAPVVSRSAVPH